MSCSIHVRVFLVALCLVSTAIVFESLLAREPSSQFTSRVLRRSSPILFSRDVAVETDDYTNVLLRAILDAPHSWELIVKGVLHSFTFWAIVSVTTLFQPVDQPGPGLSQTVCQRLSCFATRFLFAIRARVGLAVREMFTPTRVVPQRLLVTVSSASLSTPSKRHFQGHGRSHSRVTEVTF